ncbi:capsule assembly Wzi family protein [Silvimonas sp.]|uniref:capsule assembly Wzi family protein n=1 Tax=Silvimonas sp. TaxID=2650811 RepID=UPI00283BAC70|nr:capsule assembly Wzi family protein [Silvimonas sp.]MDR3429809.1 capsule assembly Wzi family protein [Silvimonas sp.]
MPSKIRLSQTLLMTFALLAGTIVQAAYPGSSPVLLQAGDAALRADLEWLANRGVLDISTSTWPLPASIVVEAVARRNIRLASPQDYATLERVVRAVEAATQNSWGTELDVNTSKIRATGFENTPLAREAASVYGQGSNDVAAAHLEVRGLNSSLTDRQSRTDLQGSYAALNVAGQILYVGQLDHWWGPGWSDSLIWSNHASAIAGVGLRNGSDAPFQTRWLSWIGPWGYELFLGQIQHDEVIAHPQVTGMRVYARPLRGLELGASRMIMWGGAGRANDARGFWKAVSGNSNTATAQDDPSDELAGFDLRYTLPFIGGNPVTLYGQAIGEDEAGHLPSKYMVLAGIGMAQSLGSHRLQWHLEATDSETDRFFGRKAGQSGLAYNHWTYRDGYYQDQLPIGSWMGGDGKSVSANLTWTPTEWRYQQQYTFRYLHAQVNPGDQAINQAFPRADTLNGLIGGVNWMVPRTHIQANVGASVIRKQSNGATQFGGLLQLRIPLDKY